MLYEGFRYVDRLVDYLDDVTRTACAINVVRFNINCISPWEVNYCSFDDVNP